MDFSHEFEILRPYNNSEVVPAIQRMMKHPFLKPVLAYVYPDKDIDQVIIDFSNLTTVEAFQDFFSQHAVREVVRKTSTGLTFSGLEQLDNTKPYLFIANHHDIVLDSAIMQVLLYENNHKTTQITFGSNLMKDPMIVDIGKLNKMFTFYRGGTKMETYKHAVLHSAYIRHVLTEKKDSVWIAQRDGRTKDGDDRTQSGLIKMLAAGRKDHRDALMDLNIVPICISYEYIPCDIQKVREMYISQTQEYIKQPNEDFNSIVGGIVGYKGGVNVCFGQPINVELQKIDAHISMNELADYVVELIDKQIHTNYTLRAINYVAFDIVNNTSEHLGQKYTDQEKADFITYVNKKVASTEITDSKLNAMFIEMYAKPVSNFLNISK